MCRAQPLPGAATQGPDSDAERRQALQGGESRRTWLLSGISGPLGMPAQMDGSFQNQLTPASARSYVSAIPAAAGRRCAASVQQPLPAALASSSAALDRDHRTCWASKAPGKLEASRQGAEQCTVPTPRALTLCGHALRLVTHRGCLVAWRCGRAEQGGGFKQAVGGSSRPEWVGTMTPQSSEMQVQPLLDALRLSAACRHRPAGR